MFLNIAFDHLNVNIAVFYANSLDIPMLLMANTAFISFVFIFKMILEVFRRF